MRFATNLVVFACLWALITGVNPGSWIVGGPVVVAAAVTAVLLASRHGWRWSVVGFLRFAPHFVRCSFLGGLDVAWRSLHPRLPIDPQLIEYDLHLPGGAARIFFMNVVNLLPGTVSADVCGDVLMVHVLDGRQPVHRQLAKLERVVERLFAMGLERIEEQGEGTA